MKVGDALDYFFCINNVSMIYFAIFVVRVAASCSFAKWKDEHKILGFDKNEQKWQSRYNPVCESLTHTTFNLFFFWNGTWFFQSLCCFGRHRWLDNTSSSITNKLILAILMFFFGLNFFLSECLFFVDTCLQTHHGPLSWIINEYSLDPWLDQNNRLNIEGKWTAQFFFGFSDLLSGVVQHKPHCNKHKLKVI